MRESGTALSSLLSLTRGLGAPSSIGIESTSELFGSAAALVHTGSAIRYPVFIKGRNYTGHGPDMLRNPFLRECVESMLAPELASVPDALIVPLGNAVSAALEYLAGRGDVSAERCLFGFPHPSGANGGRVRDFAARQPELREKVAMHFNRGPNMRLQATAAQQPFQVISAAPEPRRLGLSMRTMRAGILWVAMITCVSAADAVCVGDCNGDGMVTVEEIESALYPLALYCKALDANGDGEYFGNEISMAYLNAEFGCPPPCTADCDADGIIESADLAQSIAAALGHGAVACASMCSNNGERPCIDELVSAIRMAVAGLCN